MLLLVVLPLKILSILMTVCLCLFQNVKMMHLCVCGDREKERRLTESITFEFLIRYAFKGSGEHDAVEDAGALVGEGGAPRTSTHRERAVLPRLLLLQLLVCVLHSKAATRRFTTALVHGCFLESKKERKREEERQTVVHKKREERERKI